MQIDFDTTASEIHPLPALKYLRRKWLWFNRIYGGIAIVIGVSLAVVTPLTRSGTGALVMAGIWAVLAVLGLVLIFLPEYRLRQVAAEGQREAGNGPATITLDDAGFTLSTSKIRSSREWSTIVRINERPEWWLMYTRRTMAFVIPKRPMTPDQQDELRGFLADFGDPARV